MGGEQETAIERFVARAPRITGIASILLGMPIVVRPAIGTALGLGRDERLVRASGCLDLTVGIGLLSRRADGRWMAARLLANIPFLALCARTAATEPQRRTPALALAAALAALSVVDGFVAWRLSQS